MNPHVSTLVEDITKILIRKIVRFFGLYCLILSQCTIPQKKKELKFILQSGFSDLFLHFLKFFDGKKTKRTKKYGRNGKFQPKYPLSKKQNSPH